MKQKTIDRYIKSPIRFGLWPFKIAVLVVLGILAILITPLRILDEWSAEYSTLTLSEAAEKVINEAVEVVKTSE